MECVKCSKPIVMRLRNMDEPYWPFELNIADANDPECMKYNEYAEFSDIHFNLSLTYDELITVRNGLIPNRPRWMNQEVFINYENAIFLYHTTPVDSEKWWEQYEETRSKQMCLSCI